MIYSSFIHRNKWFGHKQFVTKYDREKILIQFIFTMLPIYGCQGKNSSRAEFLNQCAADFFQVYRQILKNPRKYQKQYYLLL